MYKSADFRHWDLFRLRYFQALWEFLQYCLEAHSALDHQGHYLQEYLREDYWDCHHLGKSGLVQCLQAMSAIVVPVQLRRHCSEMLVMNSEHLVLTGPIHWVLCLECLLREWYQEYSLDYLALWATVDLGLHHQHHLAMMVTCWDFLQLVRLGLFRTQDLCW